LAEPPELWSSKASRVPTASSPAFRDMSNQIAFTPTTNVMVPVNQFLEDVTRKVSTHTFQFGGNWRIVDNNRLFAFAYSPNGSTGFAHRTFGDKGRSSIRGGFGMYYDHFGEGVVNTFDRQGSLGLTMSLTNPSTITTPSCAVRFVSLTTIPTPFTSDQSFPSLSHQLSRASQRFCFCASVSAGRQLLVAMRFK